MYAFFVSYAVPMSIISKNGQYIGQDWIFDNDVVELTIVDITDASGVELLTRAIEELHPERPGRAKVLSFKRIR